MSASDQLRFFLGGHDLEMLTIRDLLREFAPDRFHDFCLRWGAKASAYASEIQTSLDQDETPVLIELETDLDLPEDRILVVDHHGDRAGVDAPTPLHQVFSLLKLPSVDWKRWYELVAANDRGHVPAMERIGATLEEMVEVRTRDRAAQGITDGEERAGARAASSGARALAKGRLTVVSLPHGKTATVADRLDLRLGGPGYDNLLILSPGEINFFGEGWIIRRLDDRFPGGWAGGELPKRGYWGVGRDESEVVPFVENAFCNQSGSGAGRRS